MNNNLPDNTVAIALLLTLIIVFTLIFTTRPSQIQLQPSIEWKDSTPNQQTILKI